MPAAGSWPCLGPRDQRRADGHGRVESTHQLAPHPDAPRSKGTSVKDSPLALAKVVVGLPVCNERRHVEETLRSLAAQDHADFKVLISDNASDDGSRELCKSFADGDDRFVYVRQPRNIGAAGNFAFCLDATASEHFMWCGAHDVLSGNFLSTMSSLLDHDPTAAIAFGMRLAIDEHSRPVAGMSNDDGYIYRFSNRRYPRYIQAACSLSDCVIVNGLIRRKWLSGFEIKPVLATDKVLLAHLLYFGQVRYDFSAEYRRRYFQTRETGQEERLLGTRPVVGTGGRVLVDYFLSDFASITGNRTASSVSDWRTQLLRKILFARFLGSMGRFVYRLARLSMRLTRNG